MRIFIVHAHHEPTSFNRAMTREATAALGSVGHEVVVSDLYAMGFDPVSDRRNFKTVKDPERLKQQNEEAYASEVDGYVGELQSEMDKLAWCDVLILQFPLRWLGLPAILKGWVDRVFAVGRTYGGGRYFSRGVLSSKRAMCSVAIGGPADAYSRIGAYGPLYLVLRPINHEHSCLRRVHGDRAVCCPRTGAHEFGGTCCLPRGIPKSGAGAYDRTGHSQPRHGRLRRHGVEARTPGRSRLTVRIAIR